MYHNLRVLLWPQYFTFALFLSLTFVALGLVPLNKAEAAQGPLSGFAWSSNIGWISFSSRNCDINGNGSMDSSEVSTNPACPAAGTTVAPYGVSADSVSGNLSGFAWSSNIGWIKFGGLGSFPAGVGTQSINARINFTTNKLEGWARACAGTVSGDCSSMTSRTDGWDGWISLSGQTGPRSYGVTFSGTLFTSYAWGSEVVGWMRWNPSCPVGAPLCGVTVNFPFEYYLYIDPGLLTIYKDPNDPTDNNTGRFKITVVNTGRAPPQLVTINPPLVIPTPSGSEIDASMTVLPKCTPNPACTIFHDVATTEQTVVPSDYALKYTGTPNSVSVWGYLNVREDIGNIPVDKGTCVAQDLLGNAISQIQRGMPLFWKVTDSGLMDPIATYKWYDELGQITTSVDSLRRLYPTVGDKTMTVVMTNTSGNRSSTAICSILVRSDPIWIER